jgi:PAS domain S-box-containing protein
MKKPLRVLLIEDSVEDAELLLYELRREGLDPDLERVGTPEELQLALDRKEWDLVISDYSLPNFSATYALAIIKRRCTDIPFIIVSGTIGEETAVEAMRAGAHDFVKKSHLSRLVPAIERVLREAELRRKHRRVEAQLKKLSRAVEQSPVTVVITDTKGDIEYVNPKFTELTGYTFKEVMGKNHSILKSDEHTPEFYKKLWDTITSGAVWRGELHNRKKNGELYWEDTSISPIIDNFGKATHYIAVKEDITERKEIEQELLAKTRALDVLNKDLHNLTMEITRIEDSERKRFAKILHDDIGQQLVAIEMGISTYIRDRDSGRKATLGRLSDTNTLLRATIESIRTMSSNLHPVNPYEEELLGKKGFTHAAHCYVNNVLKPNGINAEIDIDETVEELPDDYKRRIYRVLQECLQNVMKHSGASNVVIIFRADKNTLLFSVKDDGKGLPNDDIVARARSGVGLRLMRERVKSMNGTLTVISAPGKGTEVRAEFPRVCGITINKRATLEEA